MFYLEVDLLLTDETLEVDLLLTDETLSILWLRIPYGRVRQKITSVKTLANILLKLCPYGNSLST